MNKLKTNGYYTLWVEDDDAKNRIDFCSKVAVIMQSNQYARQAFLMLPNIMGQLASLNKVDWPTCIEDFKNLVAITGYNIYVSFSQNESFEDTDGDWNIVVHPNEDNSDVISEIEVARAVYNWETYEE